MSHKKYISLLSLLLITILTACQRSASEQVTDHLNRGDHFLAQHDYKQARFEYLEASRIKPHDANILYHIGLTEDAEGSFHDAFTHFKDAEQQDGHFRLVLEKLAEYYLAANQFEQADIRLQSILAQNPNDAQAHALLAIHALHEKKYDEAQTQAEASLKAEPENPMAIEALCRIYKEQDNLAKSIEVAEAAVARKPNDEQLLLILVGLYDPQKDMPKIAETYEKLLKINPSFSKYYLLLADDYLKANQNDMAEKTIRAALAAHPDDMELEHQLVLILDENHNELAAESELLKIASSNATNSDSIEWVTEFYLKHNHNDKAKSFLDQISKTHTNDKIGLIAEVAQARLDYLDKNLDAASTRLQDVLKKDPHNVNAQFLTARLEADKGQYNQAITDLQNIIRTYPKAKEVYEVLAEVLQQQNHTEPAIETLNQLIDIDPTNDTARVRLAQLYNIAGDPHKSMDLLFAVTQLNPSMALAWESIARIAISDGNWSTADLAINKLMALPNQQMVATYLRGLWLERNRKPKEAERNYRKIIDTDASAYIANLAAISLVELSQHEGNLASVTSYLVALKNRPPDLEILLGTCYLNMRNEKEATKYFNSAIEKGTSKQDAYLYLAKMALQKNDAEKALQLLDQATHIAPSDTRALSMKAEILTDKKRFPEALTVYEDLFTKDPSLDYVANNIAEIIADSQFDNPTALDKAHKLAERFATSSNPLFMDTYAWVLYRQNNLDEALQIITRAAQNKSELPAQFHYHYGAILFKNGKKSEAKNELEMATFPGADYFGIEDARKMLVEIR